MKTALHYGVVTNCISGVSFVIAVRGVIALKFDGREDIGTEKKTVMRI